MFSESEEHMVRSAGTDASARTKVSEPMLLWADMVLCMEDKHKEILQQQFPTATRDQRIIVLHIEEGQKYMQPELIEELDDACAPYF